MTLNNCWRRATKKAHRSWPRRYSGTTMAATIPAAPLLSWRGSPRCQETWKRRASILNKPCIRSMIPGLWLGVISIWAEYLISRKSGKLRWSITERPWPPVIPPRIQKLPQKKAWPILICQRRPINDEGVYEETAVLAVARAGILRNATGGPDKSACQQQPKPTGKQASAAGQDPAGVQGLQRGLRNHRRRGNGKGGQRFRCQVP